MDDLDFYRRHSPVTDPGTKRHLLRALPADPAALATVIGGVLVHRDCTQRFGFTLPEQSREEANTRYVEAILTYLGTLDERRPQDRFAGTCRDFTVLLCAMLREAGIAARARAGFAGYFADGFFDDHWVVEVWDDSHGWHLVDAQVASAPTGTYTDADIDPLNVPRAAFLVAGQAWQECRTGSRDLDRIGTSAAGLTGMWEVQGNVVRDLASLNRIETLPWDEWGLIPTHYDQLDSQSGQIIGWCAANVDRLPTANTVTQPQKFAAAMQSNAQTDIPVTCSGPATAAQGPSSGTPISLEWTAQMNLIGGREQQVKRFTGSQAALDLA